MAENFEALRNGALDVVQVFEPYPSLAVQEGAGQILYAASARGPTVYTTFIASRTGTARHHEAFAGMTRAVARTQQWVYEHSAEELADATAAFFPTIERPILTSALRRYRDAGLWARSTAVS